MQSSGLTGSRPPNACAHISCQRVALHRLVLCHAWCSCRHGLPSHMRRSHRQHCPPERRQLRAA
jgi:hypothetical protein